MTVPAGLALYAAAQCVLCIAYTHGHVKLARYHCRCFQNDAMCQDEVNNFHPHGPDLDYPGKLQQRQDQASTEQTPLAHQNGDAPSASVPQQNTDSQVGHHTGRAVAKDLRHL